MIILSMLGIKIDYFLSIFGTKNDHVKYVQD